MMKKLMTTMILGTALTGSIACLSAEELQFYSQYEQDRYVYENFFKDKKNGIFVDIGAHDGISLSNTYFFEKQMGWQGICIEPLPEIFERLKTNRNCLCIQGCIYDKADKVSFLRIHGYPEMLSGIVDNYDPRHLDRITREVKSRGGSTEVIEVTCYPLTQLLLDHGVKHVDYLSVDTEGGEMDILKSIDFDKIDIEVIDVENNYGEPFQAFLESVGYKRSPYRGPQGSPDEIYYKDRSRS
jgi:FkbM family methyltransferase